MNRPIIAGLVCIAVVLPVFAEDEAGFVSMFNGTDLTGWEGRPGAWRVEDGTITGESTEEKPCEKTHYLYWTGSQPGDFILRFKYKIVGGNSGVHFRSEERDDWDIWGYQADIEDGAQWSGCLFQHDRGGVVMRGFRSTIDEEGNKTEESIGSPEALMAKINQHDWNEYEVMAVGSRISLRINGVLMCEVDDHDKKFARDKGHIAVQMHQGPPMKIQFKDLRIKILDKDSR